MTDSFVIDVAHGAGFPRAHTDGCMPWDDVVCKNGSRIAFLQDDAFRDHGGGVEDDDDDDVAIIAETWKAFVRWQHTGFGIPHLGIGFPTRRQIHWQEVVLIPRLVETPRTETMPLDRFQAVETCRVEQDWNIPRHECADFYAAKRAIMNFR